MDLIRSLHYSCMREVPPFEGKHQRLRLPWRTRSRVGIMNTKTTSGNPQGRQTLRLSGKHPALNRLQRWIAANEALKLTLRQAAEIASLEPHYFSAVFRRHVGQSFLEWRRDHRAEVAIRLIKNGGSSMSEIVTMVGYKDRRSLE